MTIANALTLARLFSVPLLVMLIHEQAYREACALFVLAGLTDALDGWLARKLEQRSELGAYLDPLADKSLTAATLISLHLVGLVPFWLLVLVIARDLMVIGAVAISWLMDNPIPIDPLRISKVNTAAQIGLLALTLGKAGFALSLPALTMPLLHALVGTLTILSVAAYFALWFRQMAEG